MSYSPESLEAFAQAAALGSFSAAARKLGKSQSTVSEAVSRLEIDLGTGLFDRSRRQLQLTEAGKALRRHIEEILAANDRLAQMASQLLQGLEPRLTLVLSDTYYSTHYEARLAELDRLYPELEFECIVAEHGDVLSLIANGRADLGLLAARADYPPDIGHTTIGDRADFGLYVARDHPATRLRLPDLEQLSQWRSLRLKTLTADHPADDPFATAVKRVWWADSYLMLLEMATAGFGWTELPRWLVDGYSGNRLQELQVAGWPRSIAVDVVWSRVRTLGLAGNWLRQSLIER